MNKPIYFLLMLIFALSHFNVSAQESNPKSLQKAAISGLYIGGQNSTNGWGAELKYIFNKRLTLKSGFENLNLNYGFDFSQDDISIDANVDFKTGGIYLLGDLNFTKNLYVSCGVLMSRFNPTLTGKAANDLKYGDIYIPASKIGDFTFTVTPTLKASPYGSLGLRSFIGKSKRVVYNFEGGMYYMGPPQIEIEATGLLAPTADPVHGQAELFEQQLSQYNLYPVVKMSLALRLF